VILDISAVTDGLLGLVKTAWPTAPIWTELGGGPTFTPNFTGLAPDAIREESGPQLSLFLYHVEPSNEHEALFYRPQMQRGSGPPVEYIPLALNLYYLLSAYAEKSYNEEQQAMSIALRVFHANSVVRSDASANPLWELTLTMEHRAYDELSLLWQATTAPLRLSVVYRAAVLFITPETRPARAPWPKTAKIFVNGDEVDRTRP
jgi:Pvc16 N-terminal domain